MSQAARLHISDEQRATPRRRIVSRLAFALLLTTAAASPLFALAVFDAPRQNKNQTQETEQTKTPPQTSLKLVAGKSSVAPCPGDAASARVQLAASGHDPKRVPPYVWSVTGGSLRGKGATRVWDLSGEKPGGYEARVTLESRALAAAGIKQLSDAVKVSVTECEREPPPLTCPNVVVRCPRSSKAGQPLTFTAMLTRKPRAARLAEGYAWTVSSGNDKIINDQRERDTHKITVSTEGSRASSVSARFVVTGYPTVCADSCGTKIIPTPTPTPTPATPTPTPTTPTPTPTTNSNNPSGTFTPATPTPTTSPSPGASPTPTPDASPSPSQPAVVTTSPSASPSSSVNGETTDAGFVRRYWPLLLLLGLLAAGLALLAAKLYGARLRAAPPEVSLDLDIDDPTPSDDPDKKSGMEGVLVGGTTKRAADELQCSVYAPHECAPGEGFLVQAFAHLKEHAPQLEALAKEADREATRRGADNLGAVAYGQELNFHLNMPGLEVDEPLQTVVWNGEIESAQFGVNIPADFKPRRINCKLTVSIKEFPIGHVRFVFEVAAAPQAEREETPTGSAGEFVRYRKGFVSYASEDLAEVLARVQVMRLLGIDFFHDLLSLKPGERWERALYKHIDESDVFFLFWSAAAHKSEWVEKEVRYALGRKGEDDARPPEIMPVILEGPPDVPPPSYLSERHFNDPFTLLIKGVKATRAANKDA